MSDNRKPQKRANGRRNPESIYLDKLKGKEVRIGFNDGTFLDGRLTWVDRYSLGIELPGIEGYSETTEIMVQKAAIQTINPFLDKR